MVTKRHGIHVLGIESSCDDTGVALVNQEGQILSNEIHSQLKQHLSHGGIIPVVAKEYHLSNIDMIANRAFKASGLESVSKNVDAIAVSTRPGLQFSLQVGLNYARTLAKKYSKPLIPIHHMQAHALMPLLQHGHLIKFPFIALLISGGHCILSIAKRYNEFHILGNTVDEAPGDLLDKFARRCRLKNLGSPFDEISGGAAIELLSKRQGANRFKYFNQEGAVPMTQSSNCEFSFAGYRGCLDKATPIVDSLWMAGNREKLLDELGHFCASLQRLMLVQLAKKLLRALMFYRMHWRYNNEDAFANATNKEHLGFGLQKIENDEDTGAIDVVISGGVATNSYFVDGIRLACNEGFDPKIKVYAPTKALCSDNGLMVAWNGMLRYRDFLQNKEKISSGYCDDSVICDIDRMDQLHIETQCSMGLDITNQVNLARFKLSKLKHPEFIIKKC